MKIATLLFLSIYLLHLHVPHFLWSHNITVLYDKGRNLYLGPPSEHRLNYIRPDKVDSLFLISPFLDFEAGVQSFIIEVNFSWQNTTENHHRNKAFQNHVQIRGHGASKEQ